VLAGLALRLFAADDLEGLDLEQVAQRRMARRV